MKCLVGLYFVQLVYNLDYVCIEFENQVGSTGTIVQGNISDSEGGISYMM